MSGTMRLALVTLLLAGCASKEAPPAPAPSPSHVAALISPADPVDAAFKGCEAGCGKRGIDPNAHFQPGANAGDLAYCPVSGVVFKITDTSAKAEVDGKPIFFCCENCKAHFLAHRDAVVKARGM
jgi:YHS domain-containing protein